MPKQRECILCKYWVIQNDCGWVWQLCGWGRADICMTFHKRAFDIELLSLFTKHKIIIMCKKVLATISYFLSEIIK
jgi:hypothetical protein